jgi:5-methylcytosine-specific restriction endonuclease McrA
MKRDGQLSCHYCGRSGLVSALPDGHTKKDLKNLATLDHIVPRSKGGAEFDEANIVIACHTCNHRKADNLVDDVNGGIAQLAERLLRKDRKS